MPLAAPVMTAALPARRPSLTVGTLHRSHLEGDETAVDRVVAARDERSGIRAEEQGELGDLLRPPHPADRLAARQLLEHFALSARVVWARNPSTNGVWTRPGDIALQRILWAT